MKKPFQLILAGALALSMQTASAKDSFLDLPVDGAVKSPSASTLLGDVPFYMAGQDHPTVTKSIGTATTNRSTNAFNKSNEAACDIAFLSAVIALQNRAKSDGGNAVIDIKSITKGNELVSATQFRCVAGAVVAKVGLSGTSATIAKP